MSKKIEKVVIFAGGQGSRLSEHTGIIPKPLIPINGEPIVIHLMRSFYRQGYKEFILALGYKSEEFKTYFRDYNFKGKSVSFSPFGMKVHDDNKEIEDWVVHLVETGTTAETGQRLSRVRDFIGNDDFFLTYGDGLSDVKLENVENVLYSGDKVAAITAVPLQERFGILGIDGENSVTKFSEKSNNETSLINGGFMACRNELLEYVSEESGDFAYDVLTKMADHGRLGYYQHNGFWKPMDTKKDLDDFEKLFKDRPELFS